MGKTKFLINNKNGLCLISLIAFLTVPSCSFLEVRLDNEVSLNFLFIEYRRCRLTDITGEPEKINNEEYDFNLIESYCRDNITFPPKVDGGELSFFLFYEEIGGRSYVNRVELYLEWTLSNAMFEQEMNRIETATYEAYDGPRFLKHSENLFSLPSFVAMYNTYYSHFEYIIVDKEALTFRYIFLENLGDISQIVFSKEYAPSKLLKDSDLAKYSNSKGLSIYTGY